MPKIRRKNVPLAVLNHLRDRFREREISVDQLTLLTVWLNGEPEVPVGRWFKRFPSMIVCGEAELVTTFLRLGQVPTGEEVR